MATATMTRRILVTGGNKGIGLAIARRALLDFDDTYVVLACRSVERGNAAVADLAKENATFSTRTQVLQVDTASDASVREAAERWASEAESELFAICNNAGIAAGSNADVLSVNARGPKRVCDAFIPFLHPDHGRIVNISSGAAPGCVKNCSPERKTLLTNPNVTWEELDSLIQEIEVLPNAGSSLKDAGIGDVRGAYGLSKAILNAFTMLTAREHPRLAVNSCSPGMVNTNIIKDFVPWWVPRVVVNAVLYVIGAKTPDQGTVAPMHLLFGTLQGNGLFYGSDALRSPLDVPRNPGTPEFNPTDEDTQSKL